MQSEIERYLQGSTVVEPFLGLCILLGSRRETILGTEQRFFELRPRTGTSTVKIPDSQMLARGVRPVMTFAEMTDALQKPDALLKTGNVEDTGQETQIERVDRWVSLLRSGSHHGPPAILRELKKLQKRGVKLTPRETELQLTVGKIFQQEIASALNLPASKAGLRLNQAIEK